LLHQNLFRQTANAESSDDQGLYMRYALEEIQHFGYTRAAQGVYAPRRTKGWTWNDGLLPIPKKKR
jgi:hypothetical protein